MLIRRALALPIAMILVLCLAEGASTQGGPVPANTPTTFVDVNGVEHGTVTVTELLDPFTAFPAGKGPAPGAKYVVVVLSIEGTGEDGIEVYPPAIWLHDTTGGLWERSLPCCLMDEFPQPELSISTVGQGSRVSGYVGYTVPTDTTVDQVLYQAEQGVILIPADMGTPRPAVGTPVTMTRGDSTVVGTVKDVTDPYKKFAKSRPPAKGGRFVMVTASFENTGSTSFKLETSGMVLRDARGAMWAPTTVTPAKKPKVPELKTANLGPGNLVSGRLGYQVPAGVDLDGLYYQGEGGLFLLADLSAGAAAPPTTALATCADLKPWWEAVSPQLERVAALPPFQKDAKPMDLAASQAMLAELQSIVGAHLAVTPPDVLLPQHRLVLGALMVYERSARDQVDAQDQKDAGLLFSSQEAFEAAQVTMARALAEVDALGLDDCMKA